MDLRSQGLGPAKIPRRQEFPRRGSRRAQEGDVALAARGLLDHDRHHLYDHLLRLLSVGDRPRVHQDPHEDSEVSVVETVTSKQWYIVHTYSGFEKKVAESLKKRAKAYDLE